MTDALLTAIVATFIANAASAPGITGGISVMPGAENVARKTLLYQVISAPSGQTYGTSQDADIRIRFWVFDEASGAGPLIESAAAIFDANTPAPTGCDISCFKRDEPVPVSSPIKDDNGTEVWGWWFDAIFSIHKP